MYLSGDNKWVVQKHNMRAMMTSLAFPSEEEIDSAFFSKGEGRWGWQGDESREDSQTHIKGAGLVFDVARERGDLELRRGSGDVRGSNRCMRERE